MSIAITVIYLAIGLFVGVLEARDFPRRLDAAYPGTPPTKLGWGGPLLVACYSVSWPISLAVDLLTSTPIGRRRS